MKNHKHYELARRAHYNTSFSPEKRAETCCAEFDARQAEFREIGASEEAQSKLERLWIDWMHAKSRCLSSMITGPARFPVAKAEKANRSEHNKLTEYLDYFERVKKAIEKEKYYEEHPEARPISNSDSDALERLREKVAKLEALQATMKEANKIYRKNGGEAAEAFLVGSGLRPMMRESWQDDKCFQSFQLTNNNARIKQAKQRIAELERASERETEETQLSEGVQFVTDTDAMRVYFEFPGKPDDETRALLKSHGFRWTPSQGHWGRKLTANAEYSAKRVAEALRGKEAA